MWQFFETVFNLVQQHETIVSTKTKSQHSFALLSFVSSKYDLWSSFIIAGFPVSAQICTSCFN